MISWEAALSTLLDIFQCCQISLLATAAKEKPQIHTHKKNPTPNPHKSDFTKRHTGYSFADLRLHLQSTPSWKSPSTHEMSTLFILKYFPSLFSTYLLNGGHCQKMGRITVYNVRDLSIFTFQLYSISENYPVLSEN